jgi:hypothetical protein
MDRDATTAKGWTWKGGGRAIVALVLATSLLLGIAGRAGAATYSASFGVGNQTIGLTATTEAPTAQVTKVRFRVFLAPGECASFGGVQTSAPKVTVDGCYAQASLDRGEMHVGVLVSTDDRARRFKVQLHVRPLSGGPYTFDRFGALGRTNDWTSAVYVKH